MDAKPNSKQQLKNCRWIIFLLSFSYISESTVSIPSSDIRLNRSKLIVLSGGLIDGSVLGGPGDSPHAVHRDCLVSCSIRDSSYSFYPIAQRVISFRFLLDHWRSLRRWWVSRPPFALQHSGYACTEDRTDHHNSSTSDLDQGLLGLLDVGSESLPALQP
ncbi:hypothetical protein FPOAC2_07178 [Fusarium poae]